MSDKTFSKTAGIIGIVALILSIILLILDDPNTNTCMIAGFLLLLLSLEFDNKHRLSKIEEELMRYRKQEPT